MTQTSIRQFVTLITVASCLLLNVSNAQEAAPIDELQAIRQQLAETQARLTQLEGLKQSANSQISQTVAEDETTFVEQAGYSDFYADGDQSLASRVSSLESGLKKLTEPKKGPTLKINGRVHSDSWSFTDTSPGIDFFEHPSGPMVGMDPENRIFFRRIRLSFRGDVRDNMVYRIQIDFHDPFSGEMKDVYVGFKDLPVLNTLLIGNQKRPIGLDHLNSSNQNIFMERPLVVEAFNEDARRFGIASYGVSDDEVYNWRYGVYLLENMVDDGEIIGDSAQGSLNARLASTPWYDEASDGRCYFHWGVSGMLAKPDGDAGSLDTNSNMGRFRTRGELRSDSRWINTGSIAGADWYEIVGLESILNVGPLQVTGEYQTTWMQRDNSTIGTGPDLFFHGAYIYAAYMLTGEHVPINRKSGTIGRVTPHENFLQSDDCCTPKGWGAWQLAFRYSYLDLSDNDILGGVEHNAALGLVWYFNSRASLQMNAIYGDIEQHAAVGGFTGGHFTALGTRLRLDW